MNSQPDWDEFRTAFPALKNQVYLNTAGGGPICSAASRAGQRYFRDLEETGDKNWPLWLEAVEECRTRIAQILNARPEQIGFVQNASLALNHVASVTANQDTHVAMPTGEFPSVSLPWINRGSQITEFSFLEDGQPVGLNEALDLDVLVASQVQFRSGIGIDLDEISTYSRSRNATLVLDSTQAFGVRTIDVSAHPIDALMFSVYKWVGAGYGVGVLYLRDGFLKDFGYPAVGWRSSADPYALIPDKLLTTGHARDLELGHPPIPAVLALNAAVEHLQSVGVSAVQARIEELVQYLRHRISTLPLSVVTPKDIKRRAGITVIRHTHAARIAKELALRNIFISQFGDRLRLSCHAYNTEADIDALVDALEDAV